MAPGFDDDARAILAAKPSLRLIVDPLLGADAPALTPDPLGSIRTAGGAVLVGAPDVARDDRHGVATATRRAPTDAERRDLDLAWRLVRAVTSNAIVLVRDGRLIGFGSGQTSRVDAARQAVDKARRDLGRRGDPWRGLRLGRVLPVRGRGRGLPRGRRHRLRPARRLEE